MSLSYFLGRSIQSKYLLILATVLTLPFLSFYWMSLTTLFPDTWVTGASPAMTIASLVFSLPFLLSATTILSSFIGYLSTTCLGTLVLLKGLSQTHVPTMQRLWFVLLLSATLIFPFAFRYAPAVEAAPGIHMQWVTNPGWIGGMHKAIQQINDQTPCTYTILGWSPANTLSYQAVCADGTHLWYYNPQQRNSISIATPPQPLFQETIVAPSNLQSMVRSVGVRPTIYEATTRSLLIKSDGLQSPDGTWIAFVSQHIYGPQDVVLLTTK